MPPSAGRCPARAWSWPRRWWRWRWCIRLRGRGRGRCSAPWRWPPCSCWRRSGPRPSWASCTVTRWRRRWPGCSRCWRSRRWPSGWPATRPGWRRWWCSRCPSGSRSPPAAPRRTCWCRCTWWSARGCWPTRCRPCSDAGVGRGRVVTRRRGRGRGRGAGGRDGGGGRGAEGRDVAALRGADRPGAETWPEANGSGAEAGPGWVERLLALYVGLYAVQSLYSPDFTKALQQMVFFYVPFALMLCLLRRLRWGRALVRRCLAVVVGLAVIFSVIGFVEYATRTLLLNPKLIAVNNVHVYFAINSVFFDPDIFGRFLALVMVLVAAVLLHTRERRLQLGAAGVLAVLWAGLVLTLSRSSLGALLLGLGILGALRWRARPFLLAGVLLVVVGIAAVAISPTTFGLNQGLNGASAGRADLIRGGARLFAQRPGWGYGSGAFETEYLCRIQHQCDTTPAAAQTLSASHTIPITIAAEQGLVGELAYLALVLSAAVVLLRGARGDAARAAIAAAFIALVFHTLLYADFLEDPVTWTLLGAGIVLARRARARPHAVHSEAGELAVAA